MGRDGEWGKWEGARCWVDEERDGSTDRWTDGRTDELGRREKRGEQRERWEGEGEREREEGKERGSWQFWLCLHVYVYWGEL